MITRTSNLIIRFLLRLPGAIAIGLIVAYQKTVSPDHSWLMRGRFPHGFCRFYPSCSEYIKQAIAGRGLIIGSFLAVGRVIRCNPWASPSVDLHPKI